MSEKKIKTVSSKPKYKAVDPKQFSASYIDIVPKYKELCNGESVELDENNKHVSAWLNNNIIIKEI